jgi:CRISPR/Cas system-associated exonuclease Cas4 (RecB family)
LERRERKKEKTHKTHISRLQCTVKVTVEKEIGERQRKTEIVYIHRLKRLKVAIE